MDDFDQKKRQWELGALIARHQFGEKGWAFLAGHCCHSGQPLSELYKADKYSWYIAPTWWLCWNNIVEPKLAVNCAGSMDAVRKFQAKVKKSIESGAYTETHEFINRPSKP